ncbi:MAG: ABC transporter substrate-binding protein [Desulfurococcales archaeon]|nr:ABC transporter substrate-binding protein [Desulfurococcales archaeon]
MSILRRGVSKAVIAAIIVVIVVIAGVAGYLATRPAPPTTTTPTTTTPITSPTTTATTPTTTTTTTTTTPTTTATTPTTTKPKIKEVVIGLIEPLTGSHAVFGIEAKQAAELMIDIINNELGGIKSLGGAKLKLVVEDAGESPDTAKLAAEKLISEHHPTIILGAYISRLTAAVAEVTERNKVILVMDGLVDSLTEQGWKYVFRAAPKASAHGKSAVDFIMEMAKKKGIEIKTAVVMNEDSIFGQYVGKGAVEEFKKYGVEVLDHIQYPYDISDATPLVTKLKNLNPDVVVSCPYFHDGVLIAKTIQQMGFHPIFIAGAGACGYVDPDSIKAAGKAVEWYTNTYSFNPYRPTKWCKKVVEMFKERYGKLPTEAGGIIFYSMAVVYEALEKAGEMFPDDPLNPDNLRATFLALDLTDENSIAAQLYPTGHIKFAENGDNIYAGTAVLQVQTIDGTLQPVLVWPEPQPGVKPIFPRPDWSGASS